MRDASYGEYDQPQAAHWPVPDAQRPAASRRGKSHVNDGHVSREVEAEPRQGVHVAPEVISGRHPGAPAPSSSRGKGTLGVNANGLKRR